MSGGSYDYMYSRIGEDLRSKASSLESMAQTCEQRSQGPSEKRWDNGAEINLQALGECAKHLRMMSLRLSGMANLFEKWREVLRAVEWWESGDSGPEYVEDEFGKLTREPMGQSLKERVAVLEAQVKSLQLAMPAGLPKE